MTDSFKTHTTLQYGTRSFAIWSLPALGAARVARLPYALKILLENLLRFEDGVNVTRADIEALLDWDPRAQPSYEMGFRAMELLIQRIQDPARRRMKIVVETKLNMRESSGSLNPFGIPPGVGRSASAE